MTWFFQGSNYLSPYGYGVMHRMHHAYADTEDDPHSPKFDETIWKMMWKTRTIYSSIANKTLLVDKRFTEGVPDWAAFDKFCPFMAITSFLGTDIRCGILAVCHRLVVMAIAANTFLMSPIHGAIINWFAHKYGYRNFEVGDTSRNFLPVDF